MSLSAAALSDVGSLVGPPGAHTSPQPSVDSPTTYNPLRPKPGNRASGDGTRAPSYSPTTYGRGDSLSEDELLRIQNDVVGADGPHGRGAAHGGRTSLGAQVSCTGDVQGAASGAPSARRLDSLISEAGLGGEGMSAGARSNSGGSASGAFESSHPFSPVLDSEPLQSVPAPAQPRAGQLLNHHHNQQQAWGVKGPGSQRASKSGPVVSRRSSRDSNASGGTEAVAEAAMGMAPPRRQSSSRGAGSGAGAQQPHHQQPAALASTPHGGRNVRFVSSTGQDDPASAHTGAPSGPSTLPQLFSMPDGRPPRGPLPPTNRRASDGLSAAPGAPHHHLPSQPGQPPHSVPSPPAAISSPSALGPSYLTPEEEALLLPTRGGRGPPSQGPSREASLGASAGSGALRTERSADSTVQAQGGSTAAGGGQGSRGPSGSGGLRPPPNGLAQHLASPEGAPGKDTGGSGGAGGEGRGRDSARGSGRAAGTRAGSGQGQGHAGGGGGSSSNSSRALRRAHELSPISLGDPELRDALARAAVQNSVQLATGGQLPDSDWGYSRILAQHQQQQHQQQQARSAHQSPGGPGHSPGNGGAASPPGSGPDSGPNSGSGPQGFRSVPVSPHAVSGSPRGGASGPVAVGKPPLPRQPLLTPSRSLRSVLKHAGSGPGGTITVSGGELAGGGEGLEGDAGADGGGGSVGTGVAAAALPSGPVPLTAQHLAAQMLLTGGMSRRSLGPGHLQPRGSHASVASTAAGEAGGGGPAAPESPRPSLLGPPFVAGTIGGGGGGSVASVGTVNARGLVAGGGGVDGEGAVLDIEGAESVDVRIHCLTYNMGGATPPPGALPESLWTGSTLSSDTDLADVYVVATQESGPLSDWEAAVAGALGRRYVRVAAESLMSIAILVYALKPLAPHITQVRTSSVATGVGNVLGNKGGVAVTFNLAGAQVLLVGAHFAAHDQYVERRNADFHRICAGLFAPPSAASPATSAAAAAAAAGGGGGGSRTETPERGRPHAAGEQVPLGLLAADSGGSSSQRRISVDSTRSGDPGGGGGGSGSGHSSRNATPGKRSTVGPSGLGLRRPGTDNNLSRFSRGATLPGAAGGSSAPPDGASSAAEGEEDGAAAALAAGRASGGGLTRGRSRAPSFAVGGLGSEGEGEGGAGGGGGGAGSLLSRGLSRTLSGASNASSAVSTFSVFRGARHTSEASPGASTARGGRTSFFSGLSFASAQRHSTALLAHFDVVLWMGDLNYRIAGNPEVIKYAIDHNMVEVLWANDQLHAQQKKGKVLQGFHEMPISFAPTFKFAVGTDRYDLKRTPAWTDRVLYALHADPLFADLKPLYYMSVPELRTSDHKPVIAGFELSISHQHVAANKNAKHRGCVIS